ncbi:MAG: hypothetical protein MUP57_01260 [Clostridia bacterium]|nr:hypothetical protein [Clostridia bacterium]
MIQEEKTKPKLYGKHEICRCFQLSFPVGDWLIHCNVDASRKIFVTTGILVFDFERFIGERWRNERNMMKKVNPSRRFPTQFATDMHVYATVGLRLRFGQHHKSIFYSHKQFIDNRLQMRISD